MKQTTTAMAGNVVWGQFLQPPFAVSSALPWKVRVIHRTEEQGEEGGFWHRRHSLGWGDGVGKGTHAPSAWQFRGQQQAPWWEGSADPWNGDSDRHRHWSWVPALCVRHRQRKRGKLPLNHLAPLHLKIESMQQPLQERAANKRSQTRGLACLIYAQLWERREALNYHFSHRF